ncbi:STAS domain-containing protein [Crenobacter sp. SG2305]|uniref:STAS domain-containing protein n=1 Tax=Crenobacter oryzisoli TaxID=3056844 RepID=UPI0025AA36BB|nr:STAS domain-containing protein [Crenobacter sp. SG2305]MDN0085023.1 STAS domain-containing protein [Crenobacter sp. SG2305]
MLQETGVGTARLDGALTDAEGQERRRHRQGQCLMLQETGVGTARLDGALTMDSAGPLARPLTELAARGPLTLDLSGVSDADSAALALLLQARRAAETAGHTLTVTGWPTGLSGLLTLYALDELFPLPAGARA